MGKLFAVYSEHQKKYSGTFKYSKSDGTIVEVTEVSLNQNCPNNSFKDKIDLGEVVTFLGRGQYPEGNLG